MIQIKLHAKTVLNIAKVVKITQVVTHVIMAIISIICKKNVLRSIAQILIVPIVTVLMVFKNVKDAILGIILILKVLVLSVLTLPIVSNVAIPQHAKLAMTAITLMIQEIVLLTFATILIVRRAILQKIQDNALNVGIDFILTLKVSAISVLTIAKVVKMAQVVTYVIKTINSMMLFINV